MDPNQWHGRALTDEEVQRKFRELKPTVKFKYLDLSWNNLTSTPQLVDCVNFHSLESLVLFHNNITQVKATNIPSSTKTIDLRRNLISEFLSIPGDIQTVNLNYNRLVQVPNLADQKCLKELKLGHNKITAINVENLPLDIVTIQLHNNRIRECPDFSNQDKLTSLWLFGNIIKNVNIQNIPRCLHTINLSDNKIREVPDLRQLAQLKVLVLKKNKLKAFAVEHIPRGIQVIHLSQNNLEEIPDFRDHKDLEELRMQSNKIKVIEPGRIPINICILDFDKNLIKEVPDLSAYNKMLELILWSNKVSHLNEKHIPKNLMYLEMDDNKIYSIPDLSGHTAMKEIMFQDNKIAEVNEKHFPKDVKVVGLGRNRITEVPNFSKYKQIEEIRLWDNKISVIKAKHIPTEILIVNFHLNQLKEIPDLSTHKSMKEIGIQNNKLTKINAKHLPKVIEILDLCSNYISEVPNLREHKDLKELRLSNNKIRLLDPESTLPKDVQMINLSKNQLEDSGDLSKFKQLGALCLEENKIKAVEVNHLPKILHTLNLNRNELRSFPNLRQFIKLRKLFICGNKISSLDAKNVPKSVYILHVGDNLLSEIPDFSAHEMLQELKMDNNQIKIVQNNCIPSSIETLDFSLNEIETLPDVSRFKKLKQLRLKKNKIKDINKGILPSDIQILDVGINKLKDLVGLENLEMIKEIHLGENSISDIHSNHIPGSVQVLDLSKNQIKDMPNFSQHEEMTMLTLYKNLISQCNEADIPRYVQHLDLAKNKLTTLPKLNHHNDIEELKLTKNKLSNFTTTDISLNIEVVDVSRNEIKVFPNFGEHKQLRYLSLARNKLDVIPVECIPKSIETLRVDENEIEAFPDLRQHGCIIKLTMWGNKVSKLNAKHIPKDIEMLDLNRNLISEIPPLQDFDSLEELLMCVNAIEVAGGNLFPKSIRTLLLGSNKITEVGNFTDHILLEDIGLWKNEFKEFDVKQMPKSIKKLMLQENQIGQIEDWSEYDQLEELDLTKNKINSIKGLPRFLKKLEIKGNSIQTLEEGCFKSQEMYDLLRKGIKTKSLTKPPFEMFSKDFGAVTRYFSHTEMVHGSKMKRLVLLGPTEAGKTSLAETLISGKSWLADPEDRTEVVNKKIWKISQNHTYVIYDHGGHQIYSITSPLFISRQSTMLLLHDVNKSSSEEIGKTTDILRQTIQLYPEIDMSVVFTHIDQFGQESLEQHVDKIKHGIKHVIQTEACSFKSLGDQLEDESSPPEMSKTEDRHFDKAYNETKSKKQRLHYMSQLLEEKVTDLEYFQISCESLKGIEDLKKCLKDNATANEVSLSPKWLKLITWINSKGGNYLTSQEIRRKYLKYYCIFTNKGKCFQKCDDAIQYFSDIGIVLHYEKAQLQTYVFHNVEFVQTLFKSLFHHDFEKFLNWDDSKVKSLLEKYNFTSESFGIAKIQYEQDGLLEPELLSVLWKQQNLQHHESEALVGLMKSFDLCYCDSDKRLFFPWFVEHETCQMDGSIDERMDFDAAHISIQMNCKFFHSIPRNIFEKICVRVLNTATKDNPEAHRYPWKKGLDVMFGRMECVVLRDDATSTISIILKGPVEELSDLWKEMKRLVKDLESVLEDWDGIIESKHILCSHCRIRNSVHKKLGRPTGEIFRRSSDDVLNEKKRRNVTECREEKSSEVPIALLYATYEMKPQAATQAVKEYLEKEFTKGTEPPEFLFCVSVPDDGLKLMWEFNKKSQTGVVVKTEFQNGETKEEELSGFEKKITGKDTEAVRFGVAALKDGDPGKFYFAEPCFLEGDRVTKDDLKELGSICQSIHDGIHETNLLDLVERLHNQGPISETTYFGREDNFKEIRRNLTKTFKKVYNRQDYYDLCEWKICLHRVGEKDLADKIPVRDKDGQLIKLTQGHT